MKSWMIVLLAASMAACGPINPVRLMEKVRPSIFRLYPTNAMNYGATGFTVKAPSGKTYTLTNQHVCKMPGTENHLLQAVNNVDERKTIIRILEIDEVADLCILEAVPNSPGIQLASNYNSFSEIFVYGHPHLSPLSLSAGWLLGHRDVVILSEEPIEECVGDNKMIVELPTFFGLVKACVIKREAIEVTASIYPGNSGSPVLNNSGKLVGVAFATDTRTFKGLIVPFEEVQRFLSIY